MRPTNGRPARRTCGAAEVPTAEGGASESAVLAMSGRSAMRRGVRIVAAFVGTTLGLLIAGCNDSTGPTNGQTATTCTATPVQLAPGAHVIIDPAVTGGCVRIPAAGATGAEHLVVALSTTGQVTDTGLSVPYQLMAQTNIAPTTRMVAAPNGRRVRLPM